MFLFIKHFMYDLMTTNNSNPNDHFIQTLCSLTSAYYLPDTKAHGRAFTPPGETGSAQSLRSRRAPALNHDGNTRVDGPWPNRLKPLNHDEISIYSKYIYPCHVFVSCQNHKIDVNLDYRCPSGNFTLYFWGKATQAINPLEAVHQTSVWSCLKPAVMKLIHLV